MNEDASGKKSGGVDGGVKVPVAVAVNGSGGGGAKANGKVVGNGGQENGTAATTTTTLEKRKTTLEKRVRESSGVSSSSGECTSGESRAAADEAYGGGEDENNEAGSKDQKADEDGDLNMQPESANEDEGKQNGHFGAAIENGGGKPKLPRPSGTVECPRCNSKDTKFCYYNNYNIKQPRYFCKSCQRYWTSGGTLRNVPVGAGRRKHKSSSKNHDKFNKTELAGLGKNGPLATAADLVVGFTTAGLPQCVNNKSYAAVAALKPQVATLKPPQLVSQDGGTTPSRSRSKKKSKSSIPLHHPVANGSQDQLQQRNAAYAAQQAYAANAGFAQLWQQMLQMNSQRNGWNSVMPAGQAGLLVPQTGGTNQQASAQPPWWYTQMVNNLSAANPAAQLRSFQFQNQHEQEENRQ